MPQRTSNSPRAADPVGPDRDLQATEVPQALLDRRGRGTATPISEGVEHVRAYELTSAIPPVDDIGQSISTDGGKPRFMYGDGGERRMTRHLWGAILAEGLDEETRSQVEASSVAPPSIPGPLPTRAGLRLMRSGVFYAVMADGGDHEVRWPAGTLLRGGHMDRLVAEDTIIPGGARELTISTFACEGQRGPGEGRQLQVVAGILAPPTLRQLARDGDQFALWARIARLCHRFAPTSRSLVQALRSSTIESVARQEMPVLLAELEASRTLGMVMLLQGVPVAADLFRAEEDFLRARDGLVRGYLVEAMLRADCHSTDGIQVVPAQSTAGKRALARLLAAQEQGEHLESWHTFLCT